MNRPAQPSPSPAPAARRRQDRFRTWLRYRSWKVLVGVGLMALGLANIYPFLWMLGTSFKTTSEAARHREDPRPAMKYHLSAAGAQAVPQELGLSQLELIAELQTRELARSPQQRARIPLRTWVESYSSRYSTDVDIAEAELQHLLETGVLVIAPPRRDFWLGPDAPAAAPVGLNLRQQQLLEQLQQARQQQPDAPPERVSAEQFARQHELSLVEAHEELNEMVAAGLLRGTAPTRAYALADAGMTELHDGLNARQLLIMRLMHDEDEKLRRGIETFVNFRMTAEEYADKTGLYRERQQSYPDVGLAARELEALRSAIETLQRAPGDAETLSQLNDRQRQLLEQYRAGQLDKTLISPLAYAEGFGLEEAVREREYDLKLAAEELGALVMRGLMSSDRLLWQNYFIVLKDMRFWVKILTSLTLTAGVVLFTVIISSMLGYALARLQFPGKIWVLMLLLVGAVAPQEAIIIPIFRMLQPTGAFDGLWGMVLWLSVGGVGNALLMAGFFLTLPREVEEAAAMDGAGPFRTFFDVALPMARPIVMTISLFAFLRAWNDFLIPFITTQANPNMQPLAVAVYTFQQGHTGFWGLTNAAAAIMIVPVIILFLLLQKHIVKSIAVGAVKG
jgi:ABC-type glycerol-3-phosphate transport system permease component